MDKNLREYLSSAKLPLLLTSYYLEWNGYNLDIRLKGTSALKVPLGIHLPGPTVFKGKLMEHGDSQQFTDGL